MASGVYQNRPVYIYNILKDPLPTYDLVKIAGSIYQNKYLFGTEYQQSYQVSTERSKLVFGGMLRDLFIQLCLVGMASRVYQNEVQ